LIFKTVNRNGDTVEKKAYTLKDKESAKPFAEMSGYKEHSDELEISIGRGHRYRGVPLAYKVSRFI